MKEDESAREVVAEGGSVLLRDLLDVWASSMVEGCGQVEDRPNRASSQTPNDSYSQHQRTSGSRRERISHGSRSTRDRDLYTWTGSSSQGRVCSRGIGSKEEGRWRRKRKSGQGEQRDCHR